MYQEDPSRDSKVTVFHHKRSWLWQAIFFSAIRSLLLFLFYSVILLLALHLCLFTMIGMLIFPKSEVKKDRYMLLYTVIYFVLCFLIQAHWESSAKGSKCHNKYEYEVTILDVFAAEMMYTIDQNVLNVLFNVLIGSRKEWGMAGLL